MIHPARALIALCLLAAGLIGCHRTELKPAVISNALLDSLVPGVRLGAPAAPVASLYHLGVAASIGYADSTARPSRGVHGVYLFVDPPLSADGASPSSTATIASVHLGLDSRDAANRFTADVTSRLGPAERFCYTRGDEVSFDMRFWPTDSTRGILLSSRTDSVAVLVTFVTPRPDSNRSDPHACEGR
jgi:hypothetical protein